MMHGQTQVKFTVNCILPYVTSFATFYNVVPLPVEVRRNHRQACRSKYCTACFYIPWSNTLQWARATSLSRLHDYRHNTFGKTALYEWSARRRDLYPTTLNTHKRQIFMPPAGFESAMPASERLQTHALEARPPGLVCIAYSLLKLPITFGLRV